MNPEALAPDSLSILNGGGSRPLEEKESGTHAARLIWLHQLTGPPEKTTRRPGPQNKNSPKGDYKSRRGCEVVGKRSLALSEQLR